MIRILCVGKLKESYFADACGEYIKRLNRYDKTEVAEVADEKTPDAMSPAGEELVKRTEGRRLLEKIGTSDYVVALALNGKMMDSIAFADTISRLMTEGKSRLTFVIGGSLGLSREVLDRADMKLCFSPMTFPHQLFRVILLEQIYRAFRINNNEPYHK